MNIREAKEQIKNAMTAYFSKDEFGNYRIPIERQRPIFLIGAPGIGKTAIMEQIAQELEVGLVSYSMTHHTRQSALGLPFISRKNYGGKEYDVSEYTMSEIIASVYDMMEETGVKEGILFLDEINCVSETLAPAMLQFLQYKIFGRHRVPDGWIVVTAGNPPEYNKSVREFDIVTWDRLKRVDVEPDFDAWKEFAYRKGVHPAVMTYLAVKKSDFYKIETTVDGKRFVTARGWDDLSEMIKLYEENDIPVDQKLTGQYLQNPKVAKEFAIYYDLYNKYKSDYQIADILAGCASEDIVSRAANAPFDEKLSLLGLLIDAVAASTKAVLSEEQMLAQLLSELKLVKTEIAAGIAAEEILAKRIAKQQAVLHNGRRSNTMSRDDQFVLQKVISVMEQDTGLIKDKADAFGTIKADFDGRVARLKESVKSAGKELSHLFNFARIAFEGGNEMLILVTELTVNIFTSRFISKYGCKEYFDNNKELLFYERQKQIISELEEMELL